MPGDSIAHIDFGELNRRAISQPLVKHIYTADPSAHVFNEKIYIYPSHDIETGVPFDDLGSHFAMEDYHVMSLDSVGAIVTDHGVALHINDVPWAERQMWAPDAAYKSGKYYFYFPAKRPDGIFQIGVAIGDSPAGPFIAEPNPIEGSYYLSYSTGDTHLICYAVGDDPYGPFTYKGVVLNPVVGWTNHHSILEVGQKWYLFYHDSSLSKGVTHLRCVKVTELRYNDDGSIRTISAYNNQQSMSL